MTDLEKWSDEILFDIDWKLWTILYDRYGLTIEILLDGV